MADEQSHTIEEQRRDIGQLQKASGENSKEVEKLGADRVRVSKEGRKIVQKYKRALKTSIDWAKSNKIRCEQLTLALYNSEKLIKELRATNTR